MVQVREICLCLSNDQDGSPPILATENIPWPADALNRLCDRVELSVLDAYHIVLEMLPPVYRFGPPSSEGGYARLPPWVLLRAGSEETVVPHALRDRIDGIAYVEACKRLSADVFTRWHPEELDEIVGTIAQRVGAPWLRLRGQRSGTHILRLLPSDG